MVLGIKVQLNKMCIRDRFRAYTLEEILSNHEQIAKGILSKVRPLDYLQDYLHHGFYPFFLEKYT